jgi:hypothetical protein
LTRPARATSRCRRRRTWPATTSRPVESVATRSARTSGTGPRTHAGGPALGTRTQPDRPVSPVPPGNGLVDPAAFPGPTPVCDSAPKRETRCGPVEDRSVSDGASARRVNGRCGRTRARRWQGFRELAGRRSGRRAGSSAERVIALVSPRTGGLPRWCSTRPSLPAPSRVARAPTCSGRGSPVVRVGPRPSGFGRPQDHHVGGQPRLYRGVETVERHGRLLGLDRRGGRLERGDDLVQRAGF